VANRLGPAADLEGIRRRLGEIPLIAHLPADDGIASAEFLRPGDAGRVEGTSVLRRHLPVLESIVACISGDGL
jgi:hypothetical protein